MFFCGECLESETVKKIKSRFPNIMVINAYGPTEATCFVSLIEITNDMLDNTLPVGKINNTSVDIKIINEEIVLKGKSVFSGYLNYDSANCYKEDNLNCYKTSDIGIIKDNYLYCLGRCDNQIKYQGYRIELSDIENNLLKIEGVKEAVVIAKYKENSNIVKVIKGYVTVNKDITIEEIREQLSLLVPSYMIPKTIEILDEIPINNNFKYDRKVLLEND